MGDCESVYFGRQCAYAEGHNGPHWGPWPDERLGIEDAMAEIARLRAFLGQATLLRAATEMLMDRLEKHERVLTNPVYLAKELVRDRLRQIDALDA